MDYNLSPITVYKAPLSEVLLYTFLFSPPSEEEVVERDGVIIQDNLLSLRTLQAGSTTSTLEMSIPSSDPKAAYLQTESFLKFKDQLYIIKTSEEEKHGGESVLHIYAERYWYIFLKGGYSYISDFDLYNAGSAIYYALYGWTTNGQPWTHGRFDNEVYLPFEEPQTSNTLETLKDIESYWGGYLVFDYQARQVNLLNDPGEDKGVYFTYSKDVKSISRIVDTTELTTRIWMKRPDGTYIQNMGEYPYVDSFLWTDRVYDGLMEYDDTYSVSSAYLITRELLKDKAMPKITYEVTLDGLIGRDSMADQFDVLDKVSVFDEEFNRVVKARVEEMDIDWLNPERSKIVLGSRLKNLGSPESYIPPNFGGTGDTPAAPSGVVVYSEEYMDEEVPLTLVTASWNEVTSSDSGKPVNISYYMVDMSPLSTYNTTATSTTVRDLPPGTTLAVSVSAVSDKGVMSKWTEAVNIITRTYNPPETP